MSNQQPFILVKIMWLLVSRTDAQLPLSCTEASTKQHATCSHEHHSLWIQPRDCYNYVYYASDTSAVMVTRHVAASGRREADVHN